MKTTAIPPEIFGQEAQRRLIGTHDLMVALGLRSRQSVWGRVRAGTLPEPVFVNPDAGSLWDKDAIKLPDA